MPPPRNGLAIIRCEALTSRWSCGSGASCTPCSILRRAEASASGSPVSAEPSSSASYSRVREMAIWISDAANGASSAMAISGERVGVAPVPPPPKIRQHLRHRGDHTGDGGSHRGGQDVPVVDVHQLVAQHAAEFAGVEQLQDALGAADGGVLRVPAGGEGVRRHGRRNVDPRHRLVGAGRRAPGRSGAAAAPRPPSPG